MRIDWRKLEALSATLIEFLRIRVGSTPEKIHFSVLEFLSEKRQFLSYILTASAKFSQSHLHIGPICLPVLPHMMYRSGTLAQVNTFVGGTKAEGKTRRKRNDSSNALNMLVWSLK